MNVILIVSDTLRCDHLGCYGSTTAQTPSIDRLAQEAVVFDQFYSGSFPTLPCRAELFTGRFIWPYLEWGPLPAGEVTLAETLARIGYTCALVTDNLPMSHAGYGYDRGFHTRIQVRGQWYDPYVCSDATRGVLGTDSAADGGAGAGWEYEGVRLPAPPEKLGQIQRLAQHLRNASFRRTEEDYCAAQVFSQGARWLEEHARRTPFFLHLDVFDPHEPWDPPRRDVERYDPGYEGPEIIYPEMGAADRYTPAELRHIRALYAGEVTMVDRWLGQFLDAVDALGLRENTALAFMSDHGILLGERGLLGKHTGKKRGLLGWPTYPEVSSVPLLVRIPGLAPRRCSAFGHPADLMPTILELAGAERGARVRAASLMPVLQGRAGGVRDFALSSWSLRDWSRHRPSVLRTEEWSLYFWRFDVAPELYHRPTDPEEHDNVALEHPRVVRELHARYARFLRENDAPARNYWARRLLLPAFAKPGGRVRLLAPAADVSS
jgi:arylsulfatase A-like enzyme